MRRATRQWVKKADSDLRVAIGVQFVPFAADQICFLCQQSAEKYLKALLEELGQSIPKTHDLLLLLGLVQSQHPNIVALRRGLTVLARYGVAPRYPGFDATKRQAASALRWSEKVRRACRSLLGLSMTRSNKAP